MAAVFESMLSRLPASLKARLERPDLAPVCDRFASLSRRRAERAVWESTRFALFSLRCECLRAVAATAVAIQKFVSALSAGE